MKKIIYLFMLFSAFVYGQQTPNAITTNTNVSGNDYLLMYKAIGGPGSGRVITADNFISSFSLSAGSSTSTTTITIATVGGATVTGTSGRTFTLTISERVKGSGTIGYYTKLTGATTIGDGFIRDDGTDVTVDNTFICNASLGVNGDADFHGNNGFIGNTIFSGGVRITTGAALGYMLTSDASGNASWSVPSSTVSVLAGTNVSIGRSGQVFTVSVSANPVFTGSIIASNLTGTNTGDQTFSVNTGSVAISTTNSYFAIGAAGTNSVSTSGNNIIIRGATDNTSFTNGAAYITNAVTSGATGITTFTTGDLIQASATNTLIRFPTVSAGSYLRSAGVATASAWSTLKIFDAATATYIPYLGSTNTFTTSANFTYDGSQLIIVNNSSNPLMPHRTDDDDSPQTTINLRRSRSSSTQPGAGFGGQIVFSNEGSVDGTFVNSNSIMALWETAQTNATTQRNSMFQFKVMLANTLSEVWRISSAGAFSNTGAAGGAYIDLKAQTATAGTALVRAASGTLNTVAVAGQIEYNGMWYNTTSSTLRYANGGVVADFYTDVNNGTTVETELYTYTLVASGLGANGDKLTAKYGGTFNDATATSQIKVTFGGTTIFDSGAITLSTTGSWAVEVLIIRTGATTARSLVNLNTPAASTSVYTTETDITGLTLSSRNAIKITGTAGGVGGGSNDITGKLGVINFHGTANN